MKKIFWSVLVLGVIGIGVVATVPVKYLWLVLALLFIIPVLATILVGFVLPSIAISGIGGTAECGDGSKPPVILNIPKNTAMVVRNAWRSNPQTGGGYIAKREGWNFWVPTIWHVFEGFVDLMPVQEDERPMESNSQDHQLVTIDTQVTYWVDDPVLFKIMVKSFQDASKLVFQKLTIILNSASSSKTEQELTGMGKAELRQFSNEASTDLNAALADYGIETKVGIQNIHPPLEVQAAHTRKRAAKIEEEASAAEAAAVKKMIDETGASPTWTVIASMLGDALRGILGRPSPKKGGDEK